jgi:hypothetical protein
MLFGRFGAVDGSLSMAGNPAMRAGLTLNHALQ